jgi:hypothetical protein
MTVNTGAAGGQEKGQCLDFPCPADAATGDDVAVEDILVIVFKNRGIAGLYNLGEPGGLKIFLEETF